MRFHFTRVVKYTAAGVRDTWQASTRGPLTHMSGLVLKGFCCKGGEQGPGKGAEERGGEVRETEKGEREKQADQGEGEGERGGIGDGAGVTIILLHAAAPGSQQVAAQVLMAAGDDTSCCWEEPSGTACKPVTCPLDTGIRAVVVGCAQYLSPTTCFRNARQ